jgi:hypothetical protein
VFTLRLFNRLMFLGFIQKKGWLTIDGRTDYLASLRASHGTDGRDGITLGCSRRRWLLRQTSEIVRARFPEHPSHLQTDVIRAMRSHLQLSMSGQRTI